METEIEQLKRENETLKRKNTELEETNKKLDEATTSTGRLPAPQGLKPSNSRSLATSETADSSSDGELQQELMQELRETRKQLSNVQERLTVAEQVTAATQRRELIQEGVYQSLPKSLPPIARGVLPKGLPPSPECVYQSLSLESVYEERLFDTTDKHMLRSVLLPTTHRGTDVLRAQYSDLSTKLDAHVVAGHMYQRNALTLRDLQSIQSLRDRSVEAAETLLNIILEQPDAVYLCFLDILKHTEQQHIYQILVEDGYKDYDEQSSHTSVIRANYVSLLETLDVKFSGLVDQLYSTQVVSADEAEKISAELTSFRANEKLLAVLSRKSPQQFQRFLEALDDCRQQHVRDIIDNRRGENKVSHVASPRDVQAGQGTSSQQQQQQQQHYRQSLSSAPCVINKISTDGGVLGVTSVDDEMFVLLRQDVDQVAVYSINNYQLLRRLSVPGLNSHYFNDMTSCVRYKCLYMSDSDNSCIHRYELSSKFSAVRKLIARSHISRWRVPGSPGGLSVTPSCNLLVTCHEPSKLVELSADSGQCVREITLKSDIVNPRHSVQLATGQYVVCHGVWDKDLHRVCLVGDDGKVTHSYGRRCGSDVGQLKLPGHLAVDRDSQSVFVVDWGNNRVVLLSPTLKFVRCITEKLSGPCRYLDLSTRRLFVGQFDGDVVVIQ